MKHKLVTLTALAVASCGSFAQSVTLFGIADASARYVKNGDLKVKSLASGGLNTSRLGVRGTEDLGGGLVAGFWLETGVNLDSGSSSDTTRFFNRRATVSLSSSLGELRLGRDFTPTYLGYTDYDPFGDNGVAASSKFDSSLGTTRDTGTRADNQIMYLLPGGLGGVYGRAAVAAGEGVSGRRYIGGRLGFAASGFDVSSAYGETLVTPALGDDKFKTFDLGASYDFGVAKVMGYYTQSKFVNRKLADYSVGVTVPIGLLQIKAAYTHANSSGTTNVAVGSVNVDADDADQAALGFVYNLSKRTAIYGTGAYIKNKGKAVFVVASNPAIAAGQKSTGVELGLRHAF